MPGVKVTNFMGVAPKISPELLPDTVAQVARNAKLYSGDLIPYTNPVVRANALRNGVIRTLHALREPGTGALKFLTWNNDVDIVVATPDNGQDLDQRFYYTGDGAPKVSNYELAIGGPAPYPFNWYDLGLPLPPDDLVLTTVATPLVTSTTQSYKRDNANTATIRTTGPHGLRSGNEVTITGFTYRSGTYSQSGSTITVTMSGHGIEVGAQVVLNFKSGDSIDGTFSVASVPTDGTFTVTASNSVGTSGNVDWDIRSFNAQNAEITVLNATEFTYFSPGSAVATTNNTSGRVSLAGNTQERTYVFTWVTPWEEESVASKPSEELYIKEGQVVVVSGIPTQKPAGNNFIRGVRLYRTLPAATETEYYRLQTLWFPVALDTIARASGVVTVQTYYPHNLDPEDRFRLAYCTDASFDGEFEVAEVLDQYTFTYAQAEVDMAELVVDGFVYHDISEDPAKDVPRYWGYLTYDFYDDFDSKALTDTLVTDEYDPPPSGLRGLTVIQNNILAGFVGNSVFFSEPKTPHAWPKEYAVVLEHNVVGLSVISGSLVVLTDGYPYLISGSDPAAGMSVQKIDALFPCVSRRSIVKLANTVAYATNDGLAVYSPFGGSQLITKYAYNDDTWKADLDPSTIIAGYYNEAYFASYGTPQQEDSLAEPEPPTLTLPPEPPAPLGGDDGSGGDSGEEPTPPETDPLVLYRGKVTTTNWVKTGNMDGDPDGGGDAAIGTWTGYIDANTLVDTPAYGYRTPEKFLDNTRKLVELTCRRYLKVFGFEIRSYISISGFTSDPNGTAQEPLSITIGERVLTFNSADGYTYDALAGKARWRWNGDDFGMYGTTGLLLDVVIRKAP